MQRRSPYPGLQPFFVEDLAFFSGRARDVRLIVASLFASPLTLLYGPSGVGKSSALHAGVLPRLAERRNVVVVSVRDWSEDPVRSIGEAVAREAGIEFGGDLGDVVQACSGEERRRVMLVLDQFEHALAEPDVDDALVESLSRALLRPALRVSALIAIREDALAELDRFDGRLPGLFDTVLRLEYLDRAAGEDAIRRPLEAWEQATGEHVEVEDALVEAVLDAVPAGRAADRIETAQLQLVMSRVWDAERAAGSARLHARTFDALGGAHGIVRTHVRDALDGMAGPERDLAAVVLDRLVTPSGARIAHLTEDLADYAGSDAGTLRPVLERLSTARVLRPVAAAGKGGARFEVYHELLADAVLAWLTDHTADRRAAAASARARKRVLSLIAVLVVAVVVAVVLAGALIDEKRSSETAHSRAGSAAARQLLASGGDPQLALALALRAADTRLTREAQRALRATLAQSYERSVLRGPSDAVKSVDVSRDGRTLLTAEADGKLRVRARATGRLLRALPAAGVVQASFCPDGGRLAFAGDGGATLIAGSARTTLTREPAEAIACSADATTIAVREADRVRVFDARTGSVVTALSAPASEASGSVAVSADGARVAAGVAGATLVADVRGRQHRTLLRTGDDEPIASVAFSPDGRRLVTGGARGTVLVREVSPDSKVLELRGNASYVHSVAFGPDGTLVVAAGGDRVVRVWDAGTGGEVPGAAGRELAALRGHEGLVRNATFAPDGRTVATASDDGTLRLWELPVHTLLRSRTDLVGAVVARDSRHMVTATQAGAVEVSDVASGRRTAGFDARGASGFAVAPDAGRVAVIEGSGGVRAWNPAQPRESVALARPADAVRAFDYGPGGRMIALSTESGTIRVVDSSGRVAHVFRGFDPGPLTAVAFSPDGRRIAAADPIENVIFVLDARSGRVLRRIRPRDPGLITLAYSTDATRLIAGGNDGAWIWDATSGELRLRLRGHLTAVQSATFNVRGDLVETASFDGEARLWDAASGDLLTVLAGRTASFGGDRLVLWDGGRVVRRYDCDACEPAQRLRARVRSAIARRFTDAQLRAYTEG